jgi:CHAD domain-containing protein
MPAMLMDRFSKIHSYERLFAEQDQVDYPTIHLLRIDCKYLRYSLEYVRHILGEEAETLIERLKELQDLLGDLNDAVVGLAMIEGQSNNSGLSLDQQRAGQQAVIDELTAKVPDALARFTGTDSRLRLGKAIARL